MRRNVRRQHHDPDIRITTQNNNQRSSYFTRTWRESLSHFVRYHSAEFVDRRVVVDRRHRADG
jgi:hypothetical protein